MPRRLPTPLLAAAACLAWPPLHAEPPPPAVAAGVRCAGSGAAAGAALFTFAGWTVQPGPAWQWTQALAAAPALRLAADALRCAVPGPRDAAYRQADIDTQPLTAALADAAPPLRVTVVAHSSGAFVAQHWLRSLPASALAHIHYFNLDGDIGSGGNALDAAMIEKLGSVHAVYAHDGAGGESANAARMRALQALAPQRVRLVAVRGLTDVCAAAVVPGARWCLHQVLVTQRPARAAGFDLAADYGGVGPADSPRPVQTDFLLP